MDPSSNANMNTTHPHREGSANSYGSYLSNGMHSYTESSGLPTGNDDFPENFFAEELFQDNTFGQPFPQQTEPAFQPIYEQNVPRQSASPAIPQYNSPQQQFAHTQYSQPIYESRPTPQPQQSFDPRFLQRAPSNPPGSLEPYPYQPLNYPNPNYHQHLSMPHRQPTAHTANYPSRQPQMSPFMTFDSRSPELMQYRGYQDHNMQPSHNFVDPSMLNAGQISNMGAPQQPLQARPQFMPSPYFSKAGTTVDPRSLQGGQGTPLTMPAPSPSSMQQTAISSMQFPIKSEIAPKPKAPKDPHAPRKLKAKLQKDRTAAKKEGQGLASTSDSESDDLSVEEEEPEMTPAVLSVSAPTDERGKALYSAVQAVWTPRNKNAPAEKVRSGIALFGDTVRTLRDAWKAKNDSLKTAENSNTLADIPRLKADVEHYRQVMEGVVTRSLQYAHPTILKRYVVPPVVTFYPVVAFGLDTGQPFCDLTNKTIAFVTFVTSVVVMGWGACIQNFA